MRGEFIKLGEEGQTQFPPPPTNFQSTIEYIAIPGKERPEEQISRSVDNPPLNRDHELAVWRVVSQQSSSRYPGELKIISSIGGGVHRFSVIPSLLLLNIIFRKVLIILIIIYFMDI